MSEASPADPPRDRRCAGSGRRRSALFLSPSAGDDPRRGRFRRRFAGIARGVRRRLGLARRRRRQSQAGVVASRPAAPVGRNCAASSIGSPPGRWRRAAWCCAWRCGRRMRRAPSLCASACASPAPRLKRETPARKQVLEAAQGGLAFEQDRTGPPGRGLDRRHRRA